jgi:hypothetical protein
MAFLWGSIALVTGYSGYQSSNALLEIISGISFLLIIVAVITITKNNNAAQVFPLLLACSLLVLAWFADSFFWFIILFDLFATAALLFTFRLMPTVNNFILHAQDGSTLMEIKKLEFKDGDLIIKGKMMGTMPTVAQMRPEEVWKALSMMPFSVLLGLPAYLFKAWKTKGISVKPAQTKKYGY